MGHDVFISHSTRDKKVSDAACAALEQRGLRCWVAPRDILPGQEWGEAIVDGISDARVFVLVFSGHANKSQQVRREVERAVGHGLPIIPFRIEDVAPAKSLEYFISNQHWLDALTPPMARHLNYLADVIARLLADPDRAPSPETGGDAAEGEEAIPRRRYWIAGAAAVLFVAIAAGAGYWFTRGGAPGPDGNQVAPLNQTAAIPREPQLEPLYDFGRVPVGTAPDHMIDAANYLRQAAVRIDFGLQPSPARLVFVDHGNLVYRTFLGSGAYDELRLRHPTYLVLQAQGDGETYLELRFAEPMAEVRLSTPHVEPNPEGWTGGTFVAFPRLTVAALDGGGQQLAPPRIYPAWRTDLGARLPWGTIILRAPGAEGIRTVRLRVEGTIAADYPMAPVAALPASAGPNDPPPPPAPPPPPPPYNAALIVEGISGKRMAPPPAAPPPATPAR